MAASGLRKRATSGVDKRIGERIRRRRYLIGMSQDELAKALGLTYQQVQKYEVGSNRVAASVLLRIARALGTPITYFFDGLDDDGPPPDLQPLTRQQGALLRGAGNMPEEVREAFIGLASAFAKKGPR